MEDSFELRVLISSNNQSDIETLRQHIAEEVGDYVVFSANSRADFLNVLNNRKINLVITDWKTDWGNGTEIVRLSKELFPDCPVLMITPEEGESEAVDAMKAGLDGCISKSGAVLMGVGSALKSIMLQAETVFKQKSTHYQRLFDRIPVGLYRTTPSGIIMDVNTTLVQILGYLDKETLLEVTAGELYYDPHDRERWQAQIFQNGVIQNFETRLRKRDGSIIWVRDSARAIYDSDNQVLFYEGSITDITREKEAEEQLRLNASVFEKSGQGIFITDIETRIITANKACARITGYSLDEIIGKRFSDFWAEPEDEAFYTNIWIKLKHDGSWQGETFHRRKNGEIYPIWLSINSSVNEQGEITNYIAVFSDLTEKKMSEEFIEYLAHYDALTNLPNRLFFREQLNHIFSHSKRKNKSLAVIYLDIDRFKSINDSLGHFKGDILLQKFSKRLQNFLRASDIVGRMGSDEFAIVLPNIASESDAISNVSRVATKLIQSISEPFKLDGEEVFLTVSIGIAIHPQDADNSVSLIKAAETAMHKAKKHGNSFKFYKPEMDSKTLDQLTLEWSLRKAQERNEFIIYYQPLIDLKTGAINGAESLIRWKHPKRGIVSPGQFIPMAESTGLIIPIGKWVLNSSLLQAMRWREKNLPPVRLSVNLSPRQFRQEDLIRMIQEILAQTCFNPNQLELEITENCLMEDIESSIIILNALKEMGIIISVDDFGTGYSSLNYLKRFPIDKLKIDRVFVKDVIVDAHDAAIVKTLIELAHNLNLKVVAEGVETPEQTEFLKKHNCDELQGYLFSRPVPAEDFEKLLTGNMFKI